MRWSNPYLYDALCLWISYSISSFFQFPTNDFPCVPLHISLHIWHPQVAHMLYMTVAASLRYTIKHQKYFDTPSLSARIPGLNIERQDSYVNTLTLLNQTSIKPFESPLYSLIQLSAFGITFNLNAPTLYTHI